MAHQIPPAMANSSALYPPRIASPTRSTMVYSSTSRSSSRQHYTQPRDFDPILRNLSPTTTLRAFSESDLLAPGDNLGISLQSATTAQRNLGAKAAQTCLDVRSWALELEGWEWPGTFDMPEPARKKQRMSFITPTNNAQSKSSFEQNGEDTDYWGSLPSETVREYDQRADEIVQQLDEIDVEELKAFVLSAHNQAGTGAASIDDSIGAIGAATDLRRLDDFTAIITATILQALPYLSRLNRLLDTWTIRLVILRQAPRFLKALFQAQADLDRSWASVTAAQSSNGESSPRPSFTRGDMIEMQSMIEHKVGSLGRKLDRFLDNLEGRPETVPDKWVDEMEALEQKYAEWIVRAERKVLENELKNRMSRTLSPKAVQANFNDHRNLIDTEQSEADGSSTPNGENTTLFTQPSLNRRAANDETTPAGTPQHENQVTTPVSYREPTSSPRTELARIDSSTIPSGQADTIVDTSPYGSLRNSTRGARHVPIVLPYVGGDGQEYPTEGITGDTESRRGSSVYNTHPNSAIPSREPSVSFAKKRAIFAGDLERTQSLQRNTKSPVRPFEHASNAFARLFKNEASSVSSTPDRSRSSSLRSEVRRRSGSGKAENGIIWGGRSPTSPKGSTRRKTVGSGPGEAVDRPESDANSTRVEADHDAPPVPVLPPKSPRRSMHGSTNSRNLEPVPASPRIEKPQTEAFPGLDFGENWPLSPTGSTNERRTHIVAQIAELPSNGTDHAPGMSSPRKPLESESFDRMFVDSLPGTPGERAQSPVIETESVDLPEPPINRSPIHYSGVPMVDPAMLASSPQSVRRSRPAKGDGILSSPASVVRPDHIDLPTKSTLPVPPNDTDDPLTPNSVASDAYSPEIQDARVSYFQIASPPLSRRTSATIPSPQQTRPKSSQTSSPMQFRDAPKEVEEAVEEAREDKAVDEVLDEAFSFRRASKLSLESQPRLEVKSIDLTRRKSSQSSAVELEQQQTQQQQGPFDDDSPSSPVSQRDASVFPTPPAIHEERPRSPVSPLPSSSDRGWLKHKTSNLSAVSDQDTPASAKGGLNAFMGKRRGLGAHSNGSLTNLRKPPKVETDTFDRHVNEVLQQLPAPIRFRSGATTPQPRTSEPRNYSGPRPKNNPRVPSRTSTGPGGLTLAPADPTPTRKTTSANEPEVKLYHLTQAGREEPIKLFVRLVGEGERVMVRVGGGWADLADYLRQYAEHHGSRTVSGEVDIKEVNSPVTGTNSSSIHPALRRQASGPLSVAMSGGGRNSPAPVMPSNNNPQQQQENTDPNASASTTNPVTPPIPPRSHSRPSTADSSGRPGSKHSWSEIGMAGPSGSAGKKKELPESKARWVEGMVERVQKASAEKKGAGAGDGKFFGELGKVGGTRRVVFRGMNGSAVKGDS